MPDLPARCRIDREEGAVGSSRKKGRAEEGWGSVDGGACGEGPPELSRGPVESEKASFAVADDDVAVHCDGRSCDAVLGVVTPLLNAPPGRSFVRGRQGYQSDRNEQQRDYAIRLHFHTPLFTVCLCFTTRLIIPLRGVPDKRKLPAIVRAVPEG